MSDVGRHAFIAVFETFGAIGRSVYREQVIRVISQCPAFVDTPRIAAKVMGLFQCDDVINIQSTRRPNDAACVQAYPESARGAITVFGYWNQTVALEDLLACIAAVTIAVDPVRPGISIKLGNGSEWPYVEHRNSSLQVRSSQRDHKTSRLVACGLTDHLHQHARHVH